MRYNRQAGRANYIYTDRHVENLHWTNARIDRFRRPLPNPPQ